MWVIVTVFRNDFIYIGTVVHQKVSSSWMHWNRSSFTSISPCTWSASVLRCSGYSVSPEVVNSLAGMITWPSSSVGVHTAISMPTVFLLIGHSTMASGSSSVRNLCAVLYIIRSSTTIATYFLSAPSVPLSIHITVQRSDSYMLKLLALTSVKTSVSIGTIFPCSSGSFCWISCTSEAFFCISSLDSKQNRSKL